MQSINPHEPSDVVVEFEPAGPEGVERAVTRARGAIEEWGRQPAVSRGASLNGIAGELETHAEEIARLMVREVGKPITEARAEVGRAISIFRYYSQVLLTADGETYPAADGRSWLIARRFPVGMCALITPWNFPIAIPSWKLAPALAWGNTVVLKPAPEATALAQKLHELAARHLPAGVFELVPGDRETGEPLVDNQGAAAVSFTGSTEAGRAVAASTTARGAKVQAEMGGQNASIVLADADLAKAASTIAYASMGYAGQKCTATSRVIVENSVRDELRDRLVAAVEALEVLDPEKESCLVGPVIEERARESALQAIADSGGKVLTGGKAIDSQGFYLAPTLVELGDPSGALAKEEVFAPVTAMLTVSSAEEAVDTAEAAGISQLGAQVRILGGQNERDAIFACGL